MAKKSRQAKAHEFPKKAREQIIIRDYGTCIFCRMKYHMEDVNGYGQQLNSIMHYIPRSQGGLGIPENGAIGCQCHHDMMDNGKDGRRGEMMGLFRDYLMGKYPGWEEQLVKYDKWSFLKGGKR